MLDRSTPERPRSRFATIRPMSKPATKLKVAVLYGGPGSEREVSIKSGQTVIRELPTSHSTVIPVEISPKKEWLHEGKKITPAELAKLVDVAFIALHGQYGEDGGVQRELEAVHLPYTGSDAGASARCFDKQQAGRLIAQQEIAQVPEEIFCRQNELTANELAEKIEHSFGWPVVCKPLASGSSVGVTIVRRQEELEDALTVAYREGSEVLLQEYISGRELTCGTVGNSHPQTVVEPLPPVEIRTSREFFDYTAKYESGTDEICPAPLTPAETQQVQEAAVAAHQALGCAGLARTDFILTEEGRLYYLETNTVPGLTPASLCPKEAAVAGIPLGDLLWKVVDLGLERWGRLCPV